MAKKTTMQDLTRGNPMKLILGFAVPLFFGLLFQHFYNLADTMIVGQTLGEDALAAVGATGSVNFLIVGFCTGLCNGFVIPVAQQFGAGDEKALRRFAANAVWLSAVFAAAVTVAVALLCRPILCLMQTPENIFEDAYRYILAIFLGIPAAMFYNLLAGFIRSLGDSKTPVLILTAAAVVNIGLDLLFILQFGWGVAGAAWATVLSQLLSGVACLIFILIRMPVLHLKRQELKPDHAAMRLLCGMGLPMGLQYSITAIGNIVLQTSVNALGSMAVAAMATAIKISHFFACPFDALGSTMATYGGQNVGARKLDRVHQGLRSAVLLGAGYSAVALAVILLCGRHLPQLFVADAQPQLYEMAYQFLLCNAIFYFPLALVITIRFMVQGLGFSKLAVLAGVCEMIARAVAGFLLVPRFGFTAVGLASPLAWLAADVFLIYAYRRVMRQLRLSIGAAEE
ncbi:MAG: MATE family efflux transporter [Firmicutes bacterium]|nr:MATE family efflux transporter [Bacillota bacterium]